MILSLSFLSDEHADVLFLSLFLTFSFVCGVVLGFVEGGYLSTLEIMEIITGTK